MILALHISVRCRFELSRSVTVFTPAEVPATMTLTVQAGVALRLFPKSLTLRVPGTAVTVACPQDPLAPGVEVMPTVGEISPHSTCPAGTAWPTFPHDRAGRRIERAYVIALGRHDHQPVVDQWFCMHGPGQAR